jgi:hypothetical protein
MSSAEHDDNEQLLKEQQFIYEHDPTDYKSQLNRYPVNTSSVLYTFVSNLRPTMDLRRISVPIYLIRPISTLEKFSDTYRPDDCLNQIPVEQCPKQRIKLLIKSIVTPLCESATKSWQYVKPMNPILGEQFHAWYDHVDGSVTTFVAEQVSHHPPISTFHMENKENKWVYRLTNEPRVKLGWNSIEIQVHGSTTFHLLDLDETYVYQPPKYTASGIFFGAGQYCLTDKIILYCDKTEYRIELPVDYELNITGKLCHKDTVVGIFEGNFNTSLWYIDRETGQRELFIDFVNIEVNPKKVKPVWQQAENESQRVWHHLRYAMKHLKNDEIAAEQKLQVEEAERAKRANGDHEKYVPENFIKSEKSSEESPIYIHKSFSM